VPSPAPYFAKLITPLTLKHQQWTLMSPSYLDYIHLTIFTIFTLPRKEKKRKKKRKRREADKKGKLWAFAFKIPSS